MTGDGKRQILLQQQFVADIRTIIDGARQTAVRSVDYCRVQMYWQLGQRIFEEEQQGKDRADYGTYLIDNLVKEIEPVYGSGFGRRQLYYARQFYMVYPIVSALRAQLNWMQYKLLISIQDADKREYYEHEAVNNAWTGRELERQINSQLYERLLLSNDKEAVLAVAKRERIPETPQEIVKDPMGTSDNCRCMLTTMTAASVSRVRILPLASCFVRKRTTRL